MHLESKLGGLVLWALLGGGSSKKKPLMFRLDQYIGVSNRTRFIARASLLENALLSEVLSRSRGAWSETEIKSR